MKINKKFIPLILSGEKMGEIRDKNDLAGIYKIEGKHYYLDLGKESSDNGIEAHIGDREEKFHFEYNKITKEEYDGLIKNKDYGLNKNIYIYRGVKVEIKDLEEVDD